MQKIGLVVAGAVAVLALPTAAGAGGVAVFDWTGRPGRPPAVFSPGQHAEGQTSVWFGARRGRGRPQDGPYFAYLRKVDGGDFPTLEVRSTDVQLGPVDVSPPGKGSEHGSARLDFTVPEVGRGKYWVFTCNRGCELELGDLVASTIVIAREPGEARNLDMILDLKDRFGGWVNGFNHRMRKNHGRLDHRMAALASRLDSLSQDIDELRSSRERAPTSSEGIPSAAWLGIGVLFTVASLRAFRRR